MSKYGPTPEPDEEYCDGCPTGDGWHCHDCHAVFEEPDVKPVFDYPEPCCPQCGSENVTPGCGKNETLCRQERQREAGADKAYEEEGKL
jgi:hypothetical protein